MKKMVAVFFLFFAITAMAGDFTPPSGTTFQNLSFSFSVWNPGAGQNWTVRIVLSGQLPNGMPASMSSQLNGNPSQQTNFTGAQNFSLGSFQWSGGPYTNEEWGSIRGYSPFSLMTVTTVSVTVTGAYIGERDFGQGAVVVTTPTPLPTTPAPTVPPTNTPVPPTATPIPSTNTPTVPPTVAPTSAPVPTAIPAPQAPIITFAGAAAAHPGDAVKITVYIKDVNGGNVTVVIQDRPIGSTVTSDSAFSSVDGVWSGNAPYSLALDWTAAQVGDYPLKVAAMDGSFTAENSITISVSIRPTPAPTFTYTPTRVPLPPAPANTPTQTSTPTRTPIPPPTATFTQTPLPTPKTSIVKLQVSVIGIEKAGTVTANNIQAATSPEILTTISAPVAIVATAVGGEGELTGFIVNFGNGDKPAPADYFDPVNNLTAEQANITTAAKYTVMGQVAYIVASATELIKGVAYVRSATVVVRVVKFEDIPTLTPTPTVTCTPTSTPTVTPTPTVTNTPTATSTSTATPTIPLPAEITSEDVANVQGAVSEEAPVRMTIKVIGEDGKETIVRDDEKDMKVLISHPQKIGFASIVCTMQGIEINSLLIGKKVDNNSYQNLKVLSLNLSANRVEFFCGDGETIIEFISYCRKRVTEGRYEWPQKKMNVIVVAPYPPTPTATTTPLPTTTPTPTATPTRVPVSATTDKVVVGSQYQVLSEGLSVLFGSTLKIDWSGTELPQDAGEFHVYVEVNGDSREYLGRRIGGKVFLWPSSVETVSKFLSGPTVPSRYRFEIAAIKGSPRPWASSKEVFLLPSSLPAVAVLDSAGDLVEVREKDEDLPMDRELMVVADFPRMGIDATVALMVHWQVSVNDAPWDYLGQSEPMDNILRWRTGAGNVVLNYRGGPQFGSTYRFRAVVFQTNGDKKFTVPSAPVAFKLAR